MHDNYANFFVLLFWVSLGLHVGFYFIARSFCRSSWSVIFSSIVFALSATGLIGWFLADYYTGEGVNDAALFQLKHGIKGLQWSMALPIVVTLSLAYSLVIGFAFSLRRYQKQKSQHLNHKRNLALGAYIILSVLLVVVNPGWAQTSRLLALSYWDQQKIESVMEHAVLPSPPPPDLKPISAVYIYAEGLEAGFLNNDVFPNLTPNLQRLAQRGLQINGIQQVPFTGWTIAGQIASNCGFPGSEGNLVFVSDTMRFPCATNLLAKENYTLTYLNGSTLEFAGKGDFWKSQGYQHLYGDKDINRLSDYPLDRLSVWGAYDDALMEAAWRQYQKHQQQDKPFVLTLLTVDTHAPNGLDTPSCKSLPKYKMPSNQETPSLLQAVHCADFIIGSFVEKLLKELPDDTIVILQSDHLQTPRADAFVYLEKTKQRENLFLAWGNNINPKKIHRQATSFDIAPTFLSLLGRSPQSLNLGRDLLSPSPTLVEIYGKSWMEQRMRMALTDPRMKVYREIEYLRQKEAQDRLLNKKTRKHKTGDPILREKLAQK